MGGVGIIVSNKKVGLIVCLGVAAILVMTAFPVRATMTSEASTTWEEAGDTIAHGVYVGNVGGTNGPEIVTVGEAVHGWPPITKAQIRVYEHNGSALTLKASNLWNSQNGTVNVYLGVSAGDVDNDGNTEIVTVGYAGDGTDYEPFVKLWEYDGSTLTAGLAWATAIPGAFRSVHAVDIMDTATPEIVVAGDAYNETKHQGWLLFFQVDAYGITKGDEVKWTDGKDVLAYSVNAKNIDNDVNVEMVTVGYTRTSAGDPKQGEVRAWEYVSGSFTPEGDDSWQLTPPYYDTVFYGVYNANVDNSGGEEIVVCGVGHKYQDRPLIHEDWGILRVYSHDGNDFVFEEDKSWDSGDETVCRSVHAANLDGDGYLEMSAGGWTLISNTYYGEIKTFEWQGGLSAIATEDTTQWYTTSHTRVNSIFDANADSDNTIETVSAGRANDGGNDRGELRVWHL